MEIFKCIQSNQITAVSFNSFKKAKIKLIILFFITLCWIHTSDQVYIYILKTNVFLNCSFFCVCFAYIV
jgi:hypothetical protein